MNPSLTDLGTARRQFLALVADVRPDLHRYCARMTGSAIDGEDIVQDTLAHAYYELSGLKQLPALRAWLFRIAHNRALDYLRRYDRRMGKPLDGIGEPVADAALDPENALVRQDVVRAALSRFLELAPAQRSCVILKDILGYSLSEIATMLDLTVPAVKAALHRGRVRLRSQPSTRQSGGIAPAVSPALARYAELFNARDWDGVRSMLVDEVKLDVVSRTKRTGRREVESYFTNYDRWTGWRLVPGWVDGREALIVLSYPPATHPRYFVELTFVDERVAAIRDFYHVPYIAADAIIERAR